MLHRTVHGRAIRELHPRQLPQRRRRRGLARRSLSQISRAALLVHPAPGVSQLWVGLESLENKEKDRREAHELRVREKGPGGNGERVYDLEKDPAGTGACAHRVVRPGRVARARSIRKLRPSRAASGSVLGARCGVVRGAVGRPAKQGYSPPQTGGMAAFLGRDAGASRCQRARGSVCDAVSMPSWHGSLVGRPAKQGFAHAVGRAARSVRRTLSRRLRRRCSGSRELVAARPRKAVQCELVKWLA